MKARLVKRGEAYHLLLCNGKIKKISVNQAINFVKTYNDEAHYTEQGKWDFPVSMEQYEGETLASVSSKNVLSMYDTEFFKSLFEVKPITYLSSNEYAEKHGRKSAVVRRMCKDGRIKGAIFSGNTWIIPEDSPYPADSRQGKRTIVNE